LLDSLLQEIHLKIYDDALLVSVRGCGVGPSKRLSLVASSASSMPSS